MVWWAKPTDEGVPWQVLASPPDRTCKTWLSLQCACPNQATIHDCVHWLSSAPLLGLLDAVLPSPCFAILQALPLGFPTKGNLLPRSTHPSSSSTIARHRESSAAIPFGYNARPCSERHPDG